MYTMILRTHLNNLYLGTESIKKGYLLRVAFIVRILKLIISILYSIRSILYESLQTL